MFPTFEILGREISIYMICAVVGILLVLLLTYKLAKKRKLDEIEMTIMMIIAFAGVVVFSHLLYAFTVPDAVYTFFTNLDKIKSFDDLMYGLNMILGGSVFYGGLIGAILAFFIYTKARKLSFGDYSDIGALAIPLFHCFGRIGCFLSGCCYGVEWEHGITYHYAVVESANGVPRFPVQLVEAGLNLALFFVLYYLYKKGKANHKVLAYYLLVYPVYRFILEFFRGDSYRGFVLGLSTSQFISILLFSASAVYLIISYINRRKKVSA